MSPWAEVWVTASVIGAVFAVIGVWTGVGDLRALDGHNGTLRALALGYLRRQVVYLLISVGWTYIGLLSLLAGRPIPTTPAVVVLVASVIAITVVAGLELRTRRRIDRALVLAADARLDAAVAVQEGADAARMAYEAANERMDATDVHQVVQDEQLGDHERRIDGSGR